MYPTGGVLAFTNATTSAAKKSLFACKCNAASFASVVGNAPGTGNTNASALVSVLTTPFVAMSIISLK